MKLKLHLSQADRVGVFMGHNYASDGQYIGNS